MRHTQTVENRHDRLELANEAGYPRVSPGSVLAGVLVAYGAFAVLAAIAGGILNAMGVDIDAFNENDWRDLGIATGIAAGLILFLSYLYGGYVAGRMARRAGALNGVAVFVLGILVAAGVGAAIGSQTGVDGVVDNLRSVGVPTSGDQFRSIGTIAGVGSLLAMLLGAVVGGMNGERWHGKLMRRALDPTVGLTPPEALAAAGGRRPVEVRGEAGKHFARDDDRTIRDDRTISDDTIRDDDRTIRDDDRTTTLDEDLSGDSRGEDIDSDAATSGAKQPQR